MWSLTNVCIELMLNSVITAKYLLLSIVKELFVPSSSDKLNTYNTNNCHKCFLNGTNLSVMPSTCSFMQVQHYVAVLFFSKLFHSIYIYTWPV